MYYIVFTYIGYAKCETFDGLVKTVEALAEANFSIENIVLVEEE